MAKKTTLNCPLFCISVSEHGLVTLTRSVRGGLANEVSWPGFTLRLYCRETISILSDEIIVLQKRLEQNTRTKEIVQSGYDEMTTEVQTKTVKHKEALVDMQTRLSDGKRLSVDLSEQVGSPDSGCGRVSPSPPPL